MADNFRIAIPSDIQADPHVRRLLDRFSSLQMNCEIVRMEGTPYEDVLLGGYADAAVSFLEQLPVEQPEGIVVAAIVERLYPGDWLVVSPVANAPNQLFKLTENARVWAPEHRQRAQILDFRPDLQFDVRPDTAEAAWKDLLSGELPAAILKATFVMAQPTLPDDFHLQKFNPKEFVPAPGQGALAIVACREDHSTRKRLQAIHCPDISALTNIERSCLRMAGTDFKENLGVYGERDASGNYHVKALWAPLTGHLRRASLSSSTNFQLSERILKALDIFQEKYPTA